MSEKPEPDFTLDDVARDIEEAWRELKFGRDDPGCTTEELSKAWGITQGAVRKRLAQLRRAGKIMVGKRTTRVNQGENSYYRDVPVYRPKEEDESP